MYKGSHVVLVSLRGLPTAVNMNSFEYVDMIRSGNYSVMDRAGTRVLVPGEEEPMTKKEAEELKEMLLGACPDQNE